MTKAEELQINRLKSIDKSLQSIATSLELLAKVVNSQSNILTEKQLRSEGYGIVSDSEER